MSQDDNKNKSDSNQVVSDINQNSKNDNLVSRVNTESSKTKLNKPSINGWVNNNTTLQETMPGIREDIVVKATQFLTNSKVRGTPVLKQVNFLRSKGLTSDEIQVSFDRAATINNQNQKTSINQNQSQLPVNYNSSNVSSGAVQTWHEPQSWFKLLFGPIAITAIIVYVGYQIYKKYIKSWLFGKQKSLAEERLEVVELSVQKCIVLLEENKNLSEKLNKHTKQKNELDQIRAELKSIKSLLLNRFQFPPAPTSSTIPEWQLPKTSTPPVNQQIRVKDIDALKFSEPRPTKTVNSCIPVDLTSNNLSSVKDTSSVKENNESVKKNNDVPSSFKSDETPSVSQSSFHNLTTCSPVVQSKPDGNQIGVNVEI